MSEYGLIINGQKVSSDNTFAVINPANEEALAECPIASKAQLDDAVNAAAEAYKTWSKVADEERGCSVWQDFRGHRFPF